MNATSAAYNVVTRDTAGRVAVQRVHASTREQAQSQARLDGSSVISCEIESGYGIRFSPWKMQSPKRSGLDVAAFSQDFASLIDAGLSVTEALQTLAAREVKGVQRDLIDEVERMVTEGQPLSAAMKATGAFPELLIATIGASERTGDLGKGLSRYAMHQGEMRALRDKLISASVYPAVLLVVGGLVVMFLLGVVIPRFAGLLDGAKTELPMLSSALMAWGRLVADQPAVLIAFFGGLFAMTAFLVNHFRTYGVRSPWLQRIPFVAKVVREFQHLQLYRTTSILVSRGISIHRALEHSIQLLNDGDRQRLQRSIVLMREGVNISEALAQAGLSDVVAASMLKVAERTGSMAEMLERIAQFYERKLQRSIDVATRVIEPALMIVIGTVIGAIVVLMYLPIFDLASALS